jgi:hypothetical protein
MTNEIPTARTSHLEPLSVAWRVLAAPQILMILLGLDTLALVLASVVPQIPPQALGDPQAWLAVQSGPLSSAANLVRVLGLYNVYGSFWFRLLLVLTGLLLFVWLLDAADLAWRASRNRPWPATAFVHWGRHAPQVSSLSCFDQQETAARLQRFLAGLGYRWTRVAGLEVRNLVASRRGAFLWSRPLAFAALLLALAGLAIASAWGWQDPDWQPAPGDVWTVGHGTAYRLRLDSFAPESGLNGLLCDYRSQITWLQGDEALSQSLASTGRPATRDGVDVRLVGYVPDINLRAWDENGRPLTLQPAGSERSVVGRLDIVFPSSQDQPLVLLPTKDLLLSFIFEPTGADGRPSLRIVLLSDGGTQAELLGTLSESGSLVSSELRLEVDLTYRPVLQVSHRPAMALILAGLSLGLLALAASWLLSTDLLWIAIAPGEEGDVLVRLLVLPGPGRERGLLRLAARLDEVLANES